MSNNSMENRDVEALQESLLLLPSTTISNSTHQSHEVLEAERETGITRQLLLSVILVVRSSVLFQLGADYIINSSSSSSSSPSSSQTSNYEAINNGSPNKEDSGTVEADLEIEADIVLDSIISIHSEISEHQHGIELHRIQSKNITEIVKKKNLKALLSFGGVRGVAEALNTDLENGTYSSSLKLKEICQSKPYQLSQLVLITVFHSFLEACTSYTILLLFVAATLSLAFGINEKGLSINGCLNGTIIIFTILVLVFCTTVHKFFEARNFQMKLDHFWKWKESKTQVLVVREGHFLFVPANDLQVGDIAFLRKGDQVPADGIFAAGETLELDEGLTKCSTNIDETNPFLFYGSRVINGNARMIVTSVGMETVWGEMMSQAMGSSDKNCELEFYLHKMHSCINITGLLISILIIVVLFLRYRVGKLDHEHGNKPDLRDEPTRAKIIVDAIKGIVTGSRGTTRVLTTLLSVSLLGIMEGIPFVISLAIIILNRTTLDVRAVERDYLACVKMASVTIICTDKFGGHSEHEYEINNFYIGEEFVTESSVVASHVLEALCDGIGTLYLIPPGVCESKVVPVVSWAEAKLGMERQSISEKCKILDHRRCNPFQESCEVLMVRTENEGQRTFFHCKGPPPDILSLCSHYYDIDGEIQTMGFQERKKIEEAYGYMLAGEAEVIAYACKCIDASHDETTSVEPNDLIFLGMISMIGTNKEDTTEAVSTLMSSGIRTVIVSEDDFATLEAIGQNSGLLALDSGDLVLTAEEFKAWTEEEKLEKVEKICIMGNCLPSDKILLIKCLKERGNIVALLGQRTTDAPALKQADIGITFGTWSSETARESSDINIWDTNFSFLVPLIKNGRSFHENVRKFIQMQLIITISSSVINFTTTVLLGDAPMTAIQLFWLNLVFTVVGGLALLREPSTENLMTKMHLKSSGKLITITMWRNIAIQVFYQTSIFLTLQYKGRAVLGITGERLQRLIYNGFFICQLFNTFIAREPKRTNIFRGLFQQKWWFLSSSVLIVICQAMFAVAEEVLGGSPGLNWKLWGVCLLVGLGCWPVDWAAKSASTLVARLLFVIPTS